MKELGAYPLEFGQETQPVDLSRLFRNVDHVFTIALGRGQGSAGTAFHLTSETPTNNPLIAIDPSGEATVFGFTRRRVQATFASSTLNTIQARIFAGNVGTPTWEKNVTWSDAGACQDTPRRTLAASTPVFFLPGGVDLRCRFSSRSSGGVGRTVCHNSGRHKFYIAITGDIIEINNPGSWPADYQPIVINKLK